MDNRTNIEGPAAGLASTGFGTYLLDLKEILEGLPLELLQRICDVLYDAYEQERAVFFFGNGGSAALASHMVCDLGKGIYPSSSLNNGASNGFKRFKVLSLTDNVPMITAWANDASYEDIFAEQIGNFIRAGDVAFGISGSGNSPNVLKALSVSREHGATTVGLTGFQGGKMKELLDHAIIVPSNSMQQIEDAHVILAHMIFLNLKERIGNPQVAAVHSS